MKRQLTHNIALVCTSELARHFRVTERCVRYWRCIGLPSIKIARTVRFNLEEVYDWIASQSMEVSDGDR